MRVAKHVRVLRWWWIGCGSALLLLHARHAHAQAEPASVTPVHADAASAPETATPTVRKAWPQRWYGWQTLTADAAALGLLSLGISSRSDVAAYAGLGTYLIVPPVIHAAHQHWGVVGGSLVVRFLTPPIGAGVGFLAGSGACSHKNDSDQDVTCSEAGAAIGLLVGYVAAVAVDAAAFGWEPVARPATARGAPAQRLRLMPTLVLTKDHSSVGLVGTF
jgi:hypothetical protein